MLVRGLLAGSAGMLLQLAVLAQSRGSMYTFPLVFVLFGLLASGRGRALASALVVIGVSALNLGALLGVYRRTRTAATSRTRSQARETG